MTRYLPGARLSWEGVTAGQRLPSIVTVAPEGSVCSINKPDAAAIVKTGSSTGEPVTFTGRSSVLCPARFRAIVCSPALAFKLHGVVHAVPARPSSVAVAPGGWLTTRI